MVASARRLRAICWTLIVLAIISALIDIGLQLGLFVPEPNIPSGTDLVAALTLDRARDVQIYPIIVIGTIASIGLFAALALLGPALRSYAADGGWVDEIVIAFVVAGALGVASQVVNLALAHSATDGYCDCAYKGPELIAQARALGVGWTIQTWLLVGAEVLGALGIVGAGASIKVSPAWTLLSDVLLLAAVLVLVLTLIDANQLAQLTAGVFVAVALPIWAFMLARRAPELATATTS